MNEKIETKVTTELERVVRRCRWDYDQDMDVHETECGNAFSLIAGTPAENDMRFCPYCGGELWESCGASPRPVEGDVGFFNEDNKMANKDDIRKTISAGEAITALEAHIEAGMLWKMKAISLLQLVGGPGVDPQQLAELCREHAERGLNI